MLFIERRWRVGKSIKMRLIVVGFLLVAVVSGFEKVPQYYHEKVGIPEAARIKAAEEAILAKSGRARSDQEDRIVGGVVAPLNAHPYLAGLIISLVNIAGQSVCGSSLLTANRLVTAAHCWFDGQNQAWQFTVVLGSQFLFSGGSRVTTSSVVMHQQWNPFTLLNDVAMIYLPTSVTFTNAIQPIALPSGADLFDTFAGQWATAAGYGKTSDSQAGVTINTLVSHLTVPVITVQTCQLTYGPLYVQASTLCTSGAGGVGLCGGDSGGPLMVTRNGVPTLIGISSFVAANGCQLGHPSAFARVTSFYNFILQHLY